MNKNVRGSYGTINNVNEERIRNLKKAKIIKNRIVAITAAATLILSGFFIAKNLTKNSYEKQAEQIAIAQMMEDQELTTITIETEPGDSISKFASEYYNSEYRGFFDTKDEYEKAIMKENNMKSSYLDVAIKIELPIVVNKNDANYLRKVEIENKIKDIEDSNLWVKYEIQRGDLISKLASRASGSYEETRDITQQIYLKNGISSKTILNIGDKIWIMNPELGLLKTELNEIETILAESMQNNIKTK